MGDLFGKHLRKQKTRVREKLLEGLGKAKATQDDAFDQHASNLVKQTKACERLFKDLRYYGSALKAMVSAQKTLRETIRELYEPEWPERPHLCAITQSLDWQWDEFEKTFTEELIPSVNAYMAQLPILKEKVAKRGRKLVDYDGARNHYNALKASSKKKEGDLKLTKAARDFEEAKTLYEEINNELMDTLPAIYDSRITFFVNTLQTLFNAESSNHIECGKYNKRLVTYLDSLGNSLESLRVVRPESASSASLHEEVNITETPSSPPTPSPRKSSPLVSTPKPSSKEEPETEELNDNKIYPELETTVPNEKAEVFVPQEKPEVTVLKEKPAVKTPPKPTTTSAKGSKVSLNPFEEDEEADKQNSTNPFDETDEESEYKEVNETAKSVDNEREKKSEPEVFEDRKVLYKVRATHQYSAEDTDELTFDAGEVIAVLQSREEDQLDDGWLLGVKQSDGVRGVFPANFTKPL